MKVALSDHEWMDIYEGVMADAAAQRQGLRPFKVKMIRLCDLAPYDRLPVCQDLNSLIDFDEADIENEESICLFISHRWHDQHNPDDGTLISMIFRFCLNVLEYTDLLFVTATNCNARSPQQIFCLIHLYDLEIRHIIASIYSKRFHLSVYQCYV